MEMFSEHFRIFKIAMETADALLFETLYQGILENSRKEMLPVMLKTLWTMALDQGDAEWINIVSRRLKQ
jgi:hypothetical protein